MNETKQVERGDVQQNGCVYVGKQADGVISMQDFMELMDAKFATLFCDELDDDDSLQKCVDHAHSIGASVKLVSGSQKECLQSRIAGGDKTESGEAERDWRYFVANPLDFGDNETMLPARAARAGGQASREWLRTVGRHVLGNDVQTGKTCMVLWGTPGVGKTLALQRLQRECERRKVECHFVSCGDPDTNDSMKQMITYIGALVSNRSSRTVLLIDDFDCLSTAQRSALARLLSTARCRCVVVCDNLYDRSCSVLRKFSATEVRPVDWQAMVDFGMKRLKQYQCLPFATRARVEELASDADGDVRRFCIDLSGLVARNVGRHMDRESRAKSHHPVPTAGARIDGVRRRAQHEQKPPHYALFDAAKCQKFEDAAEIVRAQFDDRLEFAAQLLALNAPVYVTACDRDDDKLDCLAEMCETASMGDVVSVHRRETNYAGADALNSDKLVYQALAVDEPLAHLRANLDTHSYMSMKPSMPNKQSSTTSVVEKVASRGVLNDAYVSLLSNNSSEYAKEQWHIYCEHIDTNGVSFDIAGWSSGAKGSSSKSSTTTTTTGGGGGNSGSGPTSKQSTSVLVHLDGSSVGRCRTQHCERFDVLVQLVFPKLKELRNALLTTKVSVGKRDDAQKACHDSLKELSLFCQENGYSAEDFAEFVVLKFHRAAERPPLSIHALIKAFKNCTKTVAQGVVKPERVVVSKKRAPAKRKRSATTQVVVKEAKTSSGNGCTLTGSSKRSGLGKSKLSARQGRIDSFFKSGIKS